MEDSSNETEPQPDPIVFNILSTNQKGAKIKVVSGKGIRGAKGDKTDVADGPQPGYNNSVEQKFYVDENLVDTFANKRLSFTVFESLPKEKTAILGSADLGLYSYFVRWPTYDPNSGSPPIPPSLSFVESIPVAYMNPKLLAPPKGDEDPPKSGPELIIEVSISKPLLDAEMIEGGNFMHLKIEDVCPVPDEWTLKEGTDKDLNSNIYSYTLNFMVPSQSSTERLISIPQGSLMQSETQSSSVHQIVQIYQNKPNTGEQSSGNAGSIGSQGGVGQCDPPVTPAAPGTDKPFTPAVETLQSSKKVVWNYSYVLWLPPDAVVRLREKIASKQMLEVEVFVRELQQRFSHVQDINVNKYRGRVNVDWSSLMFPRVIGIKGRVALESFEPPTAESSGPPGSAGATSESSKVKKSKEDEWQVYKNINSTLGLQVLLEKPLLDKKKLQPITKSVRDFVPRRIIPAHYLYEKRGIKAEEEYRKAISDVVRRLVMEYRDQIILKDCTASEGSELGSDMWASSSEEEQNRKKKFMYYLNKSGAYFNLKEQLKVAVVEIVRQKFQKQSAFASKAEMQLFLSEVYVYLIDQMHMSINRMFKNNVGGSELTSRLMEESGAESLANDYQLLKTFSEEAEGDLNVGAAAFYHQERLAKYEDSIQAWYDYGCFLMRNSNQAKGEECFREVLGRQAKHIPTLLAFGSFCAIKERLEEARVYLVTAVELQPKYILGLVILLKPTRIQGLYYDAISEELESEKYIADGEKLFKETSHEGSSMFIQAALFLINCHAGPLAERALAQEVLLNGPSVEPYLLLSRLEVQRGNFVLAGERIKSALDISQDSPNVWAAQGHLQFIQEQFSDAQFSYETVLSLPNDPNDVALVYNRLGTIYLHMFQKTKESHYGKLARTMYLRATEKNPSAACWLGVGRACLALQNYEEAEDALSEANILNNRDSEVWVSISTMCIDQDRSFEAEQALKQAIRFGNRNIQLLRELGQKLLDRGLRYSAAECFRVCMENSNTENDQTEYQELFTKAVDPDSV
ncbi:hypothetical protein BJ742DRAFT_873493 [Cladochytrium replicatum]|nr:hypothetical protein BJ742DRAFT_873493 [Cladochytrium replicatum]